MKGKNNPFSGVWQID